MATRTEAAATAAVALALQRKAARRNGLLVALQRLMLRSWRVNLRDGGYDGLYDDRRVARQAAAMARLSRDGQQQAAQLEAGFQRQVLTILDVPTPRRPGLTVAPDVRGIPAEEVYARPAETFRYERSQGADVAVALERAERRLEVLTDADVQLAERQAVRDVLEPLDEVVGYRRVIRPELPPGEGHAVCGLCIVASDRIYSTDELAPIHERCYCELGVPILAGGQDPGASLNREDLDNLYRLAGSTTDGRALKRVRIKVESHGELGPVLREAAHDTRTPTEAARDRSPRRPAPAAPSGVPRDSTPQSRAAAELTALERTLTDLEARAAAGEDVSGPLAYQRERVAQLRELAAA